MSRTYYYKDSFHLKLPNGARWIVVLLFGFTDLEKQISANCKPVFIKGIGMMCSEECDLGQFENLVSGSTYNMQFERLRPSSNKTISSFMHATTSCERRKALQKAARPRQGQRDGCRGVGEAVPLIAKSAFRAGAASC